ncbi:MAG: HAD family phosphatase [Prevotella sp.]|nr:HAD family phosphatase [Prevotella sp.]
MENQSKFKAALFDLDGVVFDTEPQYTVFWGQICREYHPEKPGLEHQIKGQTLLQIYDGYFNDVKEDQPAITRRLNEFELNMAFNYIPGFESFVRDLRKHGVKTAVVTSSNREKMESVYRQHPEFKAMFDAILTSEDFAESKPSPDCYLKGAARFGIRPESCIVFEDSFNGLKSGQASGAFVVGLSTTNPEAQIKPFSNLVVSDFKALDYQKLSHFIALSK